MKNSVLSTTALALLLVVGVAPANAATFMSDTFDYSDGELTVYDGTGANVSSGAWQPHSGLTFPIPINVENGAAVVKSGNPASEDANRRAAVGGTVQTIGLGETWYYAAMVTVNDERADSMVSLNNDYFMHFFGDGNAFRGRAYVDNPNSGVGGAGFTFGVSNTSGGQQAAWATDLNFGEQYTIVMSYELDSGTSNLWVNPVDSSSTKITDVNAGGAFSVLNALALRQDFSSGGGDYEVLVDSVALGNDFDSVLLNATNGSNIPEPTTAVLAVLGLVAIGAQRRRAA